MLTALSSTALAFLKVYFEKEKVLKVLIGEPKQMNGQPSESTPIIEDFEEKGKTDDRFKELAKITKEHNGLWSKEAEDYLLANF